MKCGTHNESNMLIINILIGTDDLDPKLQICEKFAPKTECAPIFMEMEHGTC